MLPYRPRLRVDRTSRVGAGHVPCRDIGEGDGRAERDAAARVVAAHDARRVVARRIEPGDRPAVLTQDLGILVAAQAREGAEVAHHHLDGVVGRRLQRRDAGVRLVLGVAQRAVVGGAAAPVLGMLDVAGVDVVAADGLGEPSGARADLARQRLGRRAADGVALFQVVPVGHGRGLHVAQPVPPERPVVADEEG